MINDIGFLANDQFESGTKLFHDREMWRRGKMTFNDEIRMILQEIFHRGHFGNYKRGIENWLTKEMRSAEGATTRSWCFFAICDEWGEMEERKEKKEDQGN